jgi:diguanylate cyclase (GGDEF)-like protein
MKPKRQSEQGCFKPFFLTLVFALIVFIGWVRFLTGTEYAFSLLYLLPIAAVTWVKGLLWGTLSAVASTLSLLQADLALIDRFSTPYIPFINESFRLVIFMFVVFMIAKYKQILANQKEMAMIDPLTGIANRRAFFIFARTEIDRSRRYSHPFSVMVIDIDDFKSINDQFGHHTGDRLLIAVVETIRHHVRAIDIVSRFGGDEFVVLLVKTGDQSASLIAQKLQNQLLKTMKNQQWQVTFSIGVATYHSTPETVEETVRAADQLMYEVKHNGKNGIKHAVLKT